MKIRKNYLVQKDVKNASKIWLRIGTKNNNTSSHMLLDYCYIHLVCRCSLPVWRRSSLKKGTPCDLFWPRPGSEPWRIWPKNNNNCKGPLVLHPYQVSSKSIKRFWRRSWKCEKFTDGRTTDDGRCAMTIAHSSLWLRWAKQRDLIPLPLFHFTYCWIHFNFLKFNST